MPRVQSFSRLCRLLALSLLLLPSVFQLVLEDNARAEGVAAGAPLTIVVKPGQSEAELRLLLDAAAQSGRSVTIQQAPDAKTPDAGAADPSAAQPAPTTTADTQANTATAAQASGMGPSPEMMATDVGMATWGRFSAAFRRGADTAWQGLTGMSQAMGKMHGDLAAEGSTLGRALLAAFVALAGGGLLALAVRLAFLRLKPRAHREAKGVSARFRHAALRLIGELFLLALLVTLAHYLVRLQLRVGSNAEHVAHSLIAATVISLVYLVIGRLLFISGKNHPPLIDISHPRFHFRMLVGYGTINAFVGETVRIADWLGMERAAIDGWFLIGGTGLTLLKLVWFIVGRNSISASFVGARPGLVRRVVGNLLPDFYVVSAIVIWLAGFIVAGTPDSARWGFASGATQAILLALPVLALGAHAAVDELVHHCEKLHGSGLWTALLASLRVLAAGAVWIGGLHLITTLWWPLMGGEAAIATGWVIWLERFSLAIVASWAVFTLIWRYSEALAPSPHVILPGQEDDESSKRPTSRLTTALPVVRNLALGAVLAVGALIVLSSLGINVAPLLAGFGVLGLALSFGSQALVKDVVSGIFFIAEDAFRIGEYISTGSLQGTVEQISIRSVRLRHHNGPIHTVPFGQISSVSNFSRDWGTIKFQLRFERDADTEIIRKTAKKVGLAMLEDPELGPEFLIPLKMQGIQDITETAVIVRFKFTSLPGKPSILKREAMKRLIAACKAAGLEFASNAVTVRSRGGSEIDGAAAASLQPPALTPIAS